MTAPTTPAHRAPDLRPSIRETATDYARGAAGGLLVGIPLLMTMEMWWQGFQMPPFRMLLFVVFNLTILMVLERYSGFRDTYSFAEEAQDAVVAFGIGLAASALILYALHIIGPDRSWSETTGKIILETLPVSMGVSVAASQLGKQSQEARRQKMEAGFWGTQAIGIAGAMFFGLNIAVTEEPVMIALSAVWWHILLIMLLSFVTSFAMVYAVDFRGERQLPRGQPWWVILLKDGTTSYAVSLAVAAFLLWVFGRFDPATGLQSMLAMTVVLGFVTSLGSAAGNLIL